MTDVNQTDSTIEDQTPVLLVLGLPTSERIVGEVTFSQGSLIVKNALEILQRMDEATGRVSMAVTPWWIFADTDEGVSIPIQSVIIGNPSQELREVHRRSFSKIELPTQQSLILPS